ncbi:hypothetical protein B296_00020061 [Ensete ventricosum]|uniref:SRP54-type proteins GTP-binding domain-containing protein n=1 Tax=Ensete ventricosum TaxID=4639 RepID=A0A426YG59_ENSVE|nr:hypothetical protein B296_00020061 [Ensete ventricosum]
MAVAAPQLTAPFLSPPPPSSSSSSSSASYASTSILLSRSTTSSALRHRRTGPAATRFRCAAGQTGFFTRLGRLIKEKAKSDVEKVFSGFSKTRENLAVVDELLLYWNLADTDRILDELEEALLVSDFGPRISFKIVDGLREDILAGKLKSGSEIKVLLAAGDTFRAAASEQLEVWAERTGSEIVVAEGDKVKAASGLHTNYSLMEELVACKKAVAKVIPSAPNV